jgi:hypothetical protein
MRFIDGAGEFDFTRLNGQLAIAWSGGQLLSPTTGAVLATSEVFPGTFGATRAALRVADDGRHGCITERNGEQSRLWYLSMGYRAGKFSVGVADPVTVGQAGADCALDSAGQNVYVGTDAAVKRFPFQARTFDRDRPISGAGTLRMLANGESYWSGGSRWLHLSATLDDLGERALPGTRLEGLLGADETRIFERATAGGQVTATFRDRDF